MPYIAQLTVRNTIEPIEFKIELELEDGMDINDIQAIADWAIDDYTLTAAAFERLDALVLENYDTPAQQEEAFADADGMLEITDVVVYSVNNWSEM